MKLNTINISLNKKKKRVGRGIGSTKGKTSGRGHKGQKSRSGVSIKSFEGGQMPLYRRLPKRGFNRISVKKVGILNLSNLQQYFDKKNISPKEVINLAYLKKINLINQKFNKLKILGSGKLKDKADIEVDFISKSAKRKIEESGGKIIFKNKNNKS